MVDHVPKTKCDNLIEGLFRIGKVFHRSLKKFKSSNDVLDHNNGFHKKNSHQAEFGRNILRSSIGSMYELHLKDPRTVKAEQITQKLLENVRLEAKYVSI